ncbi:MAG TPA: lysophospholipid acyltransferase family protein [Solirubrobacteraceae bacterium]|jgi:1-acyl-sn-glycerol-3-phosphate acyltransferase|nr:lysophospholipid acyltransferase family protein [Solirubrobacteraceae bacterium]
MAEREQISRTYRFALAVCKPAVRWWGRLQVEGLEHVPPTGPLIVASNHDSYWDPVVVGIAAIRRRQIRALSKSTLWNVKGLDKILDGMGQIPVVRGTKDADALERAMSELRAGACVGIFIEGTRSLGRPLRARSGIGRLAAAVPEAKLVLAAVCGTTDIPRLGRRPRLKVTFFEPGGGQMRPGEDPADLAVRALAELRTLAPIAAAGRKRAKALANAPAPPPATQPAPPDPDPAQVIPPAGRAES